MALPYDNYKAILQALSLFSQGHTLTAACDEAGLPIYTLRNLLKKDTELQELYAEAEQRGYDAMADALVNIDNHKIHGHSDPKMAQVISRNIMWYLSKRNPKMYGERVQVDHSVTVDIAITAALDAARHRVITAAKPETVDAQSVPAYEDEDEKAILQQLLSPPKKERPPEASV